jgi:hypothetical protein
MVSSSMEMPIGKYKHPAWMTGVATAVSYGLILALMFALLFVVPYLLVTFVV